MAVNGYFNNFPSQKRIYSEHDLMEDVIVESIQIMGHNVYYIPRDSFDEGDMILGEYSKSTFNNAFLIEAYISNVMEHSGQGDFFSKFGLEIRDNDTFVISRRSFLKTIPSTVRSRPQEGDLVYIPVLHKMYEIKFVEQELMFHSIGKRLPFVYELKCETFRTSHEPINTGIQEVDQVGIDNSYTVGIVVDNSTYFSPGEKIFQSSNANWNAAYAIATLKEWSATSNSMLVYDITGDFKIGQSLIGNTSFAHANVISIDAKTNYSNYDLTDNEPLYEEANTILDFTETNPFGTP